MKKENLRPNLTIRYEKENRNEEHEPITKYSLVATGEKNTSLAANDELMDNGYVQPNLVIRHYDLKDQPATQTSEEIAGNNYDTTFDENTALSASKKVGGATGLRALYSKGKEIKTEPISPDFPTENKSSFGDIKKKPRADNTLKFGLAKKDSVIRRPQPRRKSDAAKLQAKIFFEKAQIALSREDILHVQKLLVTMKQYGDERSGEQYVKASKELISVLVQSQIDCKRIELISLLFPLLPPKYRYKIEKMAAILAFNKSALRGSCKDALNSNEFSIVESFVLSAIFERGSTDRTVLEEAQAILTILCKNEINLQLFYDLLPQQMLHRVKTLALEMRISRDAARPKERAANPKIENQNLNTEPNKTMKLASCQVMNAKASTKINPFNPYQRSDLQDFTKRNVPTDRSEKLTHKGKQSIGRHSSRHSRNGSLSVVDCLRQVNSDGFVQPKTRLDQINSRVKAHVPKGMVCVVCNEIPTEVRTFSCYSYIGSSLTLSFSTEKIASDGRMPPYCMLNLLEVLAQAPTNLPYLPRTNYVETFIKTSFCESYCRCCSFPNSTLCR